MAPPVRGNTHPITAYYSVYRPRKDERLSRPAWLVTYQNKVPPPGVEPVHVTHPSTNRARRRVTSLIRPTPLPLRHAANTLRHAAVYFLHSTRPSVTWLNRRWWLAACDWVMSAYLPCCEPALYVTENMERFLVQTIQATGMTFN